MHENEKYPGVPERIQLMDENGKVHENPTFSPEQATESATPLGRHDSNCWNNDSGAKLPNVFCASATLFA
ncbi:MAG: hypothetical protein ACFNLE_05820, partial [Rothia aeria]